MNKSVNKSPKRATKDFMGYPTFYGVGSKNMMVTSSKQYKSPVLF